MMSRRVHLSRVYRRYRRSCGGLSRSQVSHPADQDRLYDPLRELAAPSDLAHLGLDVSAQLDQSYLVDQSYLGTYAMRAGRRTRSGCRPGACGDYGLVVTKLTVTPLRVDSGTTAGWALDAVRGGHPMRPDIRPGGIFPDYALPDHTGTERRLGELQGRDPLSSPWRAATTAPRSTSST